MLGFHLLPKRDLWMILSWIPIYYLYYRETGTCKLPIDVNKSVQYCQKLVKQNYYQPSFYFIFPCYSNKHIQRARERSKGFLTSKNFRTHIRHTWTYKAKRIQRKWILTLQIRHSGASQETTCFVKQAKQGLIYFLSPCFYGTLSFFSLNKNNLEQETLVHWR